jgi:predicted DNA-binding transcriptional regulator
VASSTHDQLADTTVKKREPLRPVHRHRLAQMAKDQSLGALILIFSIIGIAVYGYLIFFWDALLVLEVTAFLAVLGVLGILAWIGYTLATTPPPQPIEEIEKELQAEAKKAAGTTAPASPPPTQK